MFLKKEKMELQLFNSEMGFRDTFFHNFLCEYEQKFHFTA